MSRSKILFLLSGSISAYKACHVISRLVQDGHEVQTVVTPSALKFVGAATLEGLTGKPTLSSIWEDGRAMDHIHLTRWADFAVLCPASANSIARLAHGLADDLVSAMALAWPKEKPFHIFPAMNSVMLANSSENLSKLSARGFTVHPTGAGNLACGEEGSGRLLEPEEILARIARPSKGRVLITAGATREPLDGIRFISNVSTGQTGAKIADLLAAQGWDVTYLHGESAIKPAHARLQSFSSYADLDEKLRAELAQTPYQGVIHCAAVSDYSVAQVNDSVPDAGLKLSSAGELSIKLKRNAKILPRLKEYAVDKSVKIVGFKLGLNNPKVVDAARALLGPTVDAVVANDWAEVARDRARHPGRLVLNEGEKSFTHLEELSVELGRLFEGGKT